MPDNVATFPQTHNLPKGADAAQPFEERVAKLIAAANAWAKDVPTITSEEQATKCKDLIDQVREEEDAVDKARKKERAPHDAAIDAIQNAFNPLRDRLKACTVVLKRLKEAWLLLVEERQKEEARKAQEEAEAARRKAEEAAAEAQRQLDAGKGQTVESLLEADAAAEEARLATVKAHQAARARPQMRGDLTGRASGFRTYWYAEITDRMAALTAYQGHPKLLETLQQLADADVRELHDKCRVPGITAKQGRRV